MKVTCYLAICVGLVGVIASSFTGNWTAVGFAWGTVFWSSACLVRVKADERRLRA